MTITRQPKLVGTPILINVPTFKYLSPRLLVNPMAVTLGNPDVGKPIAQEQMREVQKTKMFGCGSGNDRPISAINGMIIRAATV